MVNWVTASGIVILVIGIALALAGSLTAANSAINLFNQLRQTPLSPLSPGSSVSLSIYPSSVLIIESSNSSCLFPKPTPYASKTTANVTIMIYNQSLAVSLINNCTSSIMIRYRVFPASLASSPFITSGFLILLGGVTFIIGVVTVVVGLVIGRRRS